MLFHTWTFVLFFLIVYPVYLALKGTRFKLPWLLAASYVFYGWWSPLYLVLILWSTSVDYLAVVAMSRGRSRKPWLALSICNNLGMLGFFKYGRFLIENLNALLQQCGMPYEIVFPDSAFITDNLNALLANLGLGYSFAPMEDFLLPVGISFYVFQSMSYTIDFYRGNVAKEPSFIRYATFVSLFPQLVAGPIERAKNLLPQLRQTPTITRHDVADGLSLFVVGLFKKLALADYLAIYVERAYSSPDQCEAPALLLATFAFAWQIYFDFSGYTDMARGVGRMMGLRLMLNFNNPYLATGLGDFWHRWHISLSTWFRDYVYIPLGGNRESRLVTWWWRTVVVVAWRTTFRVTGIRLLLRLIDRGLTVAFGNSWKKFRTWHARSCQDGLRALAWAAKKIGVFTYVNICLTMIISGLWHGAAWTFVAWGALHAAGYSLTRALEKSRTYRERVPRFVKQILTFAFVTFAWIFFRAVTISDAWLIICRISTFAWSDPACPLLLLALVLSVWIYQYIYESKARRILQPAPVRGAIVVAMIIYIALFAASGEQPFIYFQF